MNHLPQHDLFPPERPVRSEYVSDQTYARRRMATVAILVLILGWVGYSMWDGDDQDPREIPTIRAETAYKEKPADPGGIDIPHQDVRVYEQLEGKGVVAPQVERLLPPPEVPKEIPPAEASVGAKGVEDVPLTEPSEKPALSVVEAPASPTVVEAPPSPQVVTPPAAPAKAAPKPPMFEVPAKAEEKAPTMSLDSIIEKINAEETGSSASPVQKGSTPVQLASLSSEAQAKTAMENLKKKYAAQLGSVQLRIVPADLGSRGIYYRVQSEPLSEEAAGRLCASLKKLGSGCILVRK